jgi:hypothetical protein
MIRVAVAVLLIIGAVNGGSWIAGILAAVLLGTAYFRFCPSYAAFGFSSEKKPDAVVK